MSHHLILVFGLLTLVACSGSGTTVGTGAGNGGAGTGTAGADLSGSWSGSWKSKTGVGGSVQITIQQSGSVVEGDVYFTNSPCFASGHYAGTVNGREVTGAVTAGGIRVDMLATVTGSSWDGTYTATQAGACTGDTGSYAVAR